HNRTAASAPYRLYSSSTGTALADSGDCSPTVVCLLCRRQARAGRGPSAQPGEGGDAGVKAVVGRWSLVVGQRPRPFANDQRPTSDDQRLPPRSKILPDCL